MKQFYFLIFFVATFQMYSQNERILLHGIIFSDSLTIDNVNVVNKSTYKGTVSNKVGKFQIFVRENDELQFSNIQYKTKQITINKIHIQKKVIEINLAQKTNELEEVVVQNMAKKLGLPNADKIPLKPTERKINFYNKGGMVNQLYGLISGDMKKLKVLQKRLDEDSILLDNKVNVQIIRNHFTDDFFINTLQVSKEHIDGLIFFSIPKGIVFIFEKERYLEVVDLLIQNKEAYLSSIK
ncbi:MAG: carboxypeptidase-like regulatory domain-containing protein [Flavobacteriaceae bacterium]|nr:carboxypeptidase-like regulatory domain-containing protein [Flavobacteriaceae bacterium]